MEAKSDTALRAMKRSVIVHPIENKQTTCQPEQCLLWSLLGRMAVAVTKPVAPTACLSDLSCYFGGSQGGRADCGTRSTPVVCSASMSAWIVNCALSSNRLLTITKDRWGRFYGSVSAESARSQEGNLARNTG